MSLDWSAGSGWELRLWRAVLEGRDEVDPFALPAWSQAWWSAFATGERAVLAVADAGVAPLIRASGGRVTVMAGEDVTDYPGPVLVPGGAPAMAAGLMDALGPWRDGWSSFEARDQRPGEGFAAALLAEARRRGLPAHVAADEPVVLMALPASVEAWLAGLSRHSRHELARKRRRLARECPGAALRTANAATLAPDLDAFLALHRASSGPKGGFMTSAREAFFRAIARELAAVGMLRLDLLEDRGRPLAVTFGFRTERSFLLYNAALEPRARTLSPGIVLAARLIERAIGEGLTGFDFLRGTERYKLELGGRVQLLERVRVG